MIYELKTYSIAPGRMSDCHRLYGEEGYAHFKPFEPNLLGYFTSEVGDLNRLVQIWKFESYEQRQQMLSSLRASPDFRRFGEKIGPLLQNQSCMLMSPAPFAKCV